MWNSTTSQFDACGDGTEDVFDEWEGEDWNNNGQVDLGAGNETIETDPLNWD